MADNNDSLSAALIRAEYRSIRRSAWSRWGYGRVMLVAICLVCGFAIGAWMGGR